MRQYGVVEIIDEEYEDQDGGPYLFVLSDLGDSPLKGFYFDSETRFHCGNDTGDYNVPEKPAFPEFPFPILFPKIDSSFLDVPLVMIDTDVDYRGGYKFTDLLVDVTTVISCCFENDQQEDEPVDEYMTRCFETLSSEKIHDEFFGYDEPISVKFTYPTHSGRFFTGRDNDACQWKFVFLSTDTHTYIYAFSTPTEFTDVMQEILDRFINSLCLEDFDIDFIDSSEAMG